MDLLAMIDWHTIEPKDAVEIWLPDRPDIRAPYNEMGQPCPWPWDPQQLVGAPLGQYHCGYCGAMVLAGLPHIDYRADWAPPKKSKWVIKQGVKNWLVRCKHGTEHCDALEQALRVYAASYGTLPDRSIPAAGFGMEEF